MNAGTIRAVLFDMDGVLVDSYDAWFHLMNAAARDLGYPAISRERFREVWGQGPDLDVELFFTRHTVVQIEQYYNRRFQDYAQYVRPNPHAKKVFSELRRRGVRIAVITNTPSPIAGEILRRVGIEPDVLVGGTDVPRGKPAPDMVLEAMDLLQVTKTQSVLVGDSHFDREAAQGAGIRFLRYNIETDGDLNAALGRLMID